MAAQVPRFAGIPSFMGLPHGGDAAGLDIALIGIPWDGGTTMRPGARHGPREIRHASGFMRRVHHASGIAPLDLCRCADLGDAPVNPVDLEDTLRRVEEFVGQIVAAGVAPLSAGGDHLVTLPILRALAAKGTHPAPFGLVQFDAHSDSWDSYFGGSRYTHGTFARRAVEEGLIDPRRTVQIGVRGSLYAADDMDFAHGAGIRVIAIEEFQDLGLAAVGDEIRQVVGDDPVYVTFDVDGVDPAFAPGTGTPEVGGLTSLEAQRLIRRLRGVAILGADVVEVSPPFDVGGATSLLGATLMFELLCVMAEHLADTTD